jgi:hypothetical protein
MWMQSDRLTREGRATRVLLLACAALVAVACGQEYRDVSYQGLEISLWGPDAALVESGSPGDPFFVSKTYEVTLKFWEDPEGTVPYADGDKLPPKFSRFSASVKFEGANTKPVITPTGEAANGFVLPRLREDQQFVYVTAEVLGINGEGKIAARARCGVRALGNRTKTNTLGPTVPCHAFFGLVGRWNPVARPAVNRRQFAAAMLPDGRVIVAGGLDATAGPGASPRSDVEIFDPALNSGRGGWVDGGLLSAARSGLTATRTDSGSIFFIGGLEAGDTYSQKVDLWDASSKSFKAAPLMVQQRGEHGAALISGDAVLAVGGRLNATTPNSSADVVLRNAPTYRNVPTLGTDFGDRFLPCVEQVAANSVLVLGGSPENKKVFQYDGTDFRPSTVEMKVARPWPKCAALGSSLFVIGGAADTLSTALEVWKDDRIEERGSSFPIPLRDHAVAVANGRIVVAGGTNPAASTAAERAIPLKGSWYVKPTAEIIPRGASSVEMTWARSEHQLVGLPDGTVMAIGGKALVGAQPGDVPGAEIFVVPDT